jgi:hypothetical protein
MIDKTTRSNLIFPEPRPIIEDSELNEPTLGLQAQDFASFLCDTGKASELKDAVDDMPEVRVVKLASFRLSNGNTVEFVGLPEIGEIGYTEIGKSGKSKPTFWLHRNLTILEKFLILSPESTSIPRMLLELDSLDNKDVLIAARSRDLVDAIPEAIDVKLDKLVLPSPPAFGGDNEIFKWDCSKGASEFEQSFCNGSGAVVEFCDPDKWETLIRNSWNGKWHKCKYSFALAAVCEDYADVTHYWWNGTSWRPRYKIWTIPAGYWIWSQYKGIGKYRRRVKYNTVWKTGYLRAYTAFHN